MTDSDEWDDALIPLAVELMTVAIGDDTIDFVEHCAARVAEEAKTTDELGRLIAILASFGGNAVREWAADMMIPAEVLMQSIVLDTQNP